MARLEFTGMSGKNMDFIMNGDRSARQIVAYLKNDASVRTFGEVLRGICPEADLAVRLTDGLSSMTGEDPGSVVRKVRNWMNGKNIPKNRETLFQICFILNAGLDGAARILGMAEENDIHYRNPRELVYAYALKYGKSYGEAQELIAALDVKDFMDAEAQVKEAASDIYTRQLREEFEGVDNDAALAEFFVRNRENFGRLHNTAYGIFDTLLSRLRQPESVNGVTEPTYSVDFLMESYLRMGVPSTKNSGDFTLLQKIIKKYWPGSKNIINIQNRKEDVSRKVLLLLAVVTELADETDVSEDMYWDDDFMEEDPETTLVRRLQEMNVLLEDCGMSRLDPCCPFDFLIIYAMKSPEEAMSERLEAVIAQLFSQG